MTTKLEIEIISDMLREVLADRSRPVEDIELILQGYCERIETRGIDTSELRAHAKRVMELRAAEHAMGAPVRLARGGLA